MIRAEETKVWEQRCYVLARALNEGNLISVYHVQNYRRDKCWIKGRPVGQLPRVSSSEGRYDINRIIVNVVPVNSGFHRWKNFTENYQQFGNTRSRILTSLVLNRKKFRKYQFQTAQNYWRARGAKLLACTNRSLTSGRHWSRSNQIILFLPFYYKRIQNKEKTRDTGFEILTPVTVIIHMFWEVMPYIEVLIPQKLQLRAQILAS